MDRDAAAPPDGLPVLDRVPGTANAFVATGHSTLGITVAAVTGARMAEFVSTGTAPASLGPFRFPRFNGRSKAPGHLPSAA